MKPSYIVTETLREKPKDEFLDQGLRNIYGEFYNSGYAEDVAEKLTKTRNRSFSVYMLIGTVRLKPVEVEWVKERPE